MKSSAVEKFDERSAAAATDAVQVSEGFAWHVNIGDTEDDENNDSTKSSGLPSSNEIPAKRTLTTLIAKFQPKTHATSPGSDVDPYLWFESKENKPRSKNAKRVFR